MMFKLAYLIILSIFACSCASSFDSNLKNYKNWEAKFRKRHQKPGDSQFYQVKTKHDEFDGYTLVFTVGNKLNFVNYCSRRIELNLYKHIDKAKNVTYCFAVVYRGDKWLFIEPGESLIFLIDGEKVSFAGAGSNSKTQFLKFNDFGDAKITEIAYYACDMPDIKKIKDAKSVKIKVAGQWEEKAVFGTRNFEVFRRFFCEHMRPAKGNNSIHTRR